MKLPENLSARTSYHPGGDQLRAEAFELLLACEAQFLTSLNRKEREQLHDLPSRVIDL
jgi:hypothetical protein